MTADPEVIELLTNISRGVGVLCMMSGAIFGLMLGRGSWKCGS